MERIPEMLIISGTSLCFLKGLDQLQAAAVWILSTGWQLLTLSLAVRIAIKHFREMQRPSRGWIAGDYLTVLIKTHVLFFAA